MPIFTTPLPRKEAVKKIDWELQKMFAPRIDYRGTMVEVNGVGVLICGKANVGKSECAIDLIQKGHRLIGDDLIEIIKRSDTELLARGKYPISNKMELRGVGIIDVVQLMGISAVKESQEVELIIELERWVPEKSYDRLGIEEKRKDILGVSVTYVEIPVAPGRNTAILIEIAAMNYCLRKKGIVAAQELEKEVIESFKIKDEES